MKIISLLIFLSCVSAALAQSGRIKPSETPTPTPRATIIYNPTQTNFPKPSPTPTPKPVADADGDEVIRVDSSLVPLPVSVTDAQGRAVTTLKLEDFLLEVDGQAAEISELSRSNAPVRLAMLFDNSSSVRVAREFEKKAAIRFFKQVIRPDRDLAALFSVASTTQLEQPFTKNVSSLVDAIERFPEPQGGTQLLDGIIKAAEYLQPFDGRRVIVVVSDGEDNLSDSTLEETVRIVQASNCQIYVVKTSEFESMMLTGQRSPNANIRFLAAERRMQELAKQTGGAVYSPIEEKELDASFTRISAELSQQYILNYYPDDQNAKRGEFRLISLKVKNRENLIVRTRKGYYVPKKN